MKLPNKYLTQNIDIQNTIVDGQINVIMAHYPWIQNAREENQPRRVLNLSS